MPWTEIFIIMNDDGSIVETITHVYKHVLFLTAHEATTKYEIRKTDKGWTWKIKISGQGVNRYMPGLQPGVVGAIPTDRIALDGSTS